MEFKNVKKFKKNFKVISDENDFNNLMDEIGAKKLSNFFEKSQYQNKLELQLKLIESIYKTPFMQECIELLIKTDKMEADRNNEYFGFTDSYRKFDITLSDLIIKDYLKFIYDYLERYKPCKKVGDNIEYDPKPYDTMNIINYGCVYGFEDFSYDELETLYKNLKYIHYSDFKKMILDSVDNEIFDCKSKLDTAENEFADNTDNRRKSSLNGNVTDLKNKLNELMNHKASLLKDNEKVLKANHCEHCNKLTITRYGLSLKDIRMFLTHFNNECGIFVQYFTLSIMIQKYIQNIIHLKNIHSNEPKSLEQLTLLGYTASGKKILNQRISYMNLSDIMEMVIKDYGTDSFKYLHKMLTELGNIEIDTKDVMKDARIDMGSYTKGRPLTINKYYLGYLFLHLLRNTGDLKQAALHQNTDDSINDNIIYVYSTIDNCYRYFDIEGKLNWLTIKILKLVSFSETSGREDDKFVYETMKLIRKFIKQDAMDKNSLFKLRNVLGYTAFVVDNGTIIMPKTTGEFIFCENLYSERIITFRKFKGIFDKVKFDENYKTYNNMLSVYFRNKIKYGLTSTGSLDTNVYGLFCACILNLFQHDIDTQTAIIILGPNGEGKSLLLNAIRKLDSLQVENTLAADFALEHYAEKFSTREVEKYQTVYKAEFSVKEYNDNAAIKRAIERTFSTVEEKFKDRVTIEINAKGLYVGEEMLKIKFDGGLKERIVVFYVNDRPIKIKFPEDVHGAESFLEYDITSTLCGLYDGFLFQAEHGVFKSDSSARIYTNLAKKYNPKTFREFTESVTNIGGVDTIIEIDKFGILNQVDLSKVMQIAVNSKMSMDFSEVKKDTLQMYLRRFRDFNKDSMIYNNLDLSTTNAHKAKNVTLVRKKFSFGIKFNIDFLNELLVRLKLESVKNKTDIADLDGIIKRNNNYNVYDVKYILKHFSQIIRMSEEDIIELEHLQSKKLDILSDVKLELSDIISGSLDGTGTQSPASVKSQNNIGDSVIQNDSNDFMN